METLREVRKKARLTQVDAAKLCGVSRRKYQMYEEKDQSNDVYDQLLNTLKEMGITGKGPALLSVRYIKEFASKVFANYPEIKCAYLFGSYARGQATVKSDVDIIVVAEPMGMKFYKLASELEEALGKDVDLQSHRQLAGDEDFIGRILTEGIKIYGQNFNQASLRFNP